MLAQDHLTLRLTRLKHQEEWANTGRGLAIVFPKGGSGDYISKTSIQRLAPGNVVVLKAESGGVIKPVAGGELVFQWFSFCLEHLFPLFGSSEIPLLEDVMNGFKGVKLYPTASPLAVSCHQILAVIPSQFNLDHRSQLLTIVAAILSAEFKAVQGQRVGFVRAEEHMIQVFEKLSMTELLTLSVGELAAKFGCSRRHLSRLFHQHFGFSVAALRMEMRLLKAVSLLRDPNAKVINVAEQCGFNHLGLFNTCFKRRFGASPGQWRKSTIEAESQSGGQTNGAHTCPLHSNGLCPWTGKPDKSNPALLKAAELQNSNGSGISAGLRRREVFFDGSPQTNSHEAHQTNAAVRF